MTKTRIGTMSLTGKAGFIELPDEATLYCPACDSPVTDDKECSANFAVVSLGESEEKLAVVLYVDCKKCGCSNMSPVI